MLKNVVGQVCGRDYDVVRPIVIHEQDRRKAGNRIHVNGLTKANGEHIRFKSLAKAESHIHNMRLQRA